MRLCEIRIADIYVHPDMQINKEDMRLVRIFEKALRFGYKLPPIRVCHKDSHYRLIDGKNV